MAAQAIPIPPQMPSPQMPQIQRPATPEEYTPDDPQLAKDKQDQLDKQEQAEDAALLLIITTEKTSWRDKRQALIRRVLRAFEYLKNNPYSVMNEGTNQMDPISMVMSGDTAADDPKLYAYNDNVYQMLCLSFIACLVPDVPKVRWMPDDPENEGDLSFSKKASTMMAYIERKNDMTSVQVLALLYLFVTGSYYCNIRNMVDAVRAGITKVPIMAMQPQEMMPNRYICDNCGSPNPENQLHPMGPKTCLDCGNALGDKDFYPAESMDVPVQVGEDEQANSFTAIDIWCLLNVDLDPDAAELSKTSILDLEGEMAPASVRKSYPERYADIVAGQFGDETVNDPEARTARETVSSPSVRRSLNSTANKGTFSRCWIQDWAFYSLDDEAMAKILKAKYPKGVKVVRFGDVILEKRPEALCDHWTECRTIKGMGMNPFGVGDVAISVQDRLDDTANNIHAYQDRLALPPVLANANLVDSAALSKQVWGGGRVISVYGSQKSMGQKFSLSEAMWQPQFHVDSKIYDYSQTLMQLMQLLTGIQPQIFGGGTTRGVDTASGQEQMLNTAMGRLMLFLGNVRAENAIRAKLAVKCMASDIDDQQRITIQGEVEGEYENEYILQSDVQGEIHGYPEADQGFPASYGEMRDRLMQLLGMVEKNPILQNMLSDPDTQKLIGLYLLPDGMKQPGEAQRTKVKLILQSLAKGAPTMIGGMLMPSIQPDPDADDMSVLVVITKDWMLRNYTMANTNPNGYANARAYLKLASQMEQTAQAKQAAMQAAAQQPHGAPAGGGAQAA